MSEQMEKISETEGVRCHFIESRLCRTVYVNGAHGGPTSNGLLQVALYNERLPTPNNITRQYREDGRLGEEVVEKREVFDGIIREVEVNAFISPDLVRPLGEWLIRQADILDGLELK